MKRQDNTAILEILEKLENIENKFKSTIKEVNKRFEKIEEQMHLMQWKINYLADKVSDNHCGIK